jgi:hypothetical protein
VAYLIILVYIYYCYYSLLLLLVVARRLGNSSIILRLSLLRMRPHIRWVLMPLHGCIPFLTTRLGWAVTLETLVMPA